MLVSDKENKYRQSIIRNIEEHFFYRLLKTEFDKILGITEYQIHNKLGLDVGEYGDLIKDSISKIEEYYKQSQLKTITKGGGVGRSRYVKFRKGKLVGEKHKKEVLKFIDEIGRDSFLKYGLVYNQTSVIDGKIFMYDGVIPIEDEFSKKFKLKELEIEKKVKKYPLNKSQLEEYNRYIFIRDYFEKKYDNIYFIFIGWYRKKMIIEQFQLTNQITQLNQFLLKDFFDYTIRRVKVDEEWDKVVYKLWNKEYLVGRFIQTNISWKKYINNEEGLTFKNYYNNLNMNKDIGFLLNRDNYNFIDFKNYIFSYLDGLNNSY